MLIAIHSTLSPHEFWQRRVKLAKRIVAVGLNGGGGLETPIEFLQLFAYMTTNSRLNKRIYPASRDLRFVLTWLLDLLCSFSLFISSRLLKATQIEASYALPFRYLD